jgi:transforming growth factor-beta-induced protein
MRKNWLLAGALAATVAFGSLPVRAQEDPGTIADIVVASTEAETPEFTTLLAAVGLADPAVLETLANPEAELTVFAPTDAAFAALQEELGEEAFAAVLEDQEMLTNILLFHVVEGEALAADVVSSLELVAERGVNLSVETLLGQYIDIATNEEGAPTINGANLVTTDIQASNGVIHVIDAVILPETRTIAEIVVGATEAETPEFTTLLAAVGAADPAILEALSDPEAELTVFAPTDAAFAALGEETLAAVVADQAAVTGILQYHVVEGINGSAAVGQLLGDAESVEVPTLLEGGVLTIAPVAEDAEVGVITVNGATVIMFDIDAANGIIHVIDAVLVPAE